MQLLARIKLIALLVCFPLVANAELVRCTSADGKSSILQRGKCASPDDIQASITATVPLMKRSDTNTVPVRCTSKDGKKVSIQRGNCESPDDYQQRLQ